MALQRFLLAGAIRSSEDLAARPEGGITCFGAFAAFGFLASRLLRFCPLAISVSHWPARGRHDA